MRTLLVATLVALSLGLVGTLTATAAPVGNGAVIKEAGAAGETFRPAAQQYRQRVVPVVRGYRARSDFRGCTQQVLDPSAPRPGVLRTVDRCRQRNPGAYR